MSCIWRVLYRQRFLPSLHFIVQISSLCREEGCFWGGSVIHHSSLLCHCRLPKSCFNVWNPKFIFSQPQRDLADSTLGQGLFMGNPGAQMGVDWLLLRGFPALPRCQSQTWGRNMISTSAFPLACSHYASSGMTRTPYVPPPKAHSLQGYTTLEKKDIIPLHEWLSTQKAERIVPQRTVCFVVTKLKVGC